MKFDLHKFMPQANEKKVNKTFDQSSLFPNAEEGQKISFLHETKDREKNFFTRTIKKSLLKI